MPSRKGFTLVELMITVAIVAILAAAGYTIYSGVQKSARNSQRKMDVDAIAKGYEANYNSVKNQYTLLGTSDFQSGKFPVPPENPQGYYDGFNSSQYFSTTTAQGSSWRVCARLEGRTAVCTVENSDCYCRSSTQGRTADAIGSGSTLMPGGAGGGGIPVSPIPTDGLVLWLDASQINQADTTQVSGGSVIKWVSSPYCCNKDAVPKVGYTASTYMPAYISNGINGKPLVMFGGTKYLEVPSLTGNTFFTLIIVGKYVSGYPFTLGNPPWENNSPNAGLILNLGFDYMQGITGGYKENWIASGVPTWNTTNTIVTYVFNGGFSCYKLLNSTNCTTGMTANGAITNAPYTENLILGGVNWNTIYPNEITYTGQADFAEIILYNRPLVGSASLDTERNQVINYLITKYAL